MLKNKTLERKMHKKLKYAPYWPEKLFELIYVGMWAGLIA